MYTDFLEQPICEGDEIVYAQSAYGGGAQLKRAQILKIVPLVTHRDARRPDTYMRQDQERNASPTEFRDDAYADPSKRYVIQIMKEVWASRSYVEAHGPKVQKYTIPCSQHIFKVPVQS